MSDDAKLDDFVESQPDEENSVKDKKKMEVEIPPKTVELPSQWELMELQEVGDLKPSNVDKKSRESETPVELCNYMDVYNNEYITNELDFMKATASEREIERFLLDEGDVIFTKDSEEKFDIAVPAVVQDQLDNVLCGYHLFLIKPDNEIVHGAYLSKSLQHYPVSSHLGSRANGTTRFGLTVSSTERAKVPIPPLPEQQKIATILYTVDQAIQKTKEVIEQTERTQKGHIRHLFRKGVSDEATETHEVLGEMPTSWQITELSNIADVVMGSSPKSEYYNESGDGLPFYQGNNDFNRRNPTTNVWCTDPVKQAKKGDILISIRAPVGDLNIATEDCCIGRGLAAIRPQSIDFDYLYYHLYERNNWFNRISSGSTFDSINSSQISNTKIKLPPKSIQEKIGSILRNNELYILKEEEYLNQLQRLKQGLIQDLLSGEIRTTDADINIPEEVAKYG